VTPLPCLTLHSPYVAQSRRRLSSPQRHTAVYLQVKLPRPCLLLIATCLIDPYCSLAGERSGRPHVADALTTPVVMTSTYFFRDTAHLIDFVVSRLSNACGMCTHMAQGTNKDTNKDTNKGVKESSAWHLRRCLCNLSTELLGKLELSSEGASVVPLGFPTLVFLLIPGGPHGELRVRPLRQPHSRHCGAEDQVRREEEAPVC